MALEVMICSCRFSSTILGGLAPVFYLGFLYLSLTQVFDWTLADPLIPLNRNLSRSSFSFLPLKSKREQITGLLTCCAARSIEGEHSLKWRRTHGGDVEGFKHDLKEQCRTEDYQKSQLSWPAEWLVILLGVPVPVNPAPHSMEFLAWTAHTAGPQKTLLH